MDYSDDSEVLFVPIDSVEVNPHQPRQEYCQDSLTELAASIRSVGILHPPLVQPRDDGPGYLLVSGERRLRAAKLAGLQTIPVVVRTGDEIFSAQAALIENIQRVDLNPMEIAKALKKLIEKFGYTQEYLAGVLGKKRSTVANYLRLLTLPDNIQRSTSMGNISMGHAKAILSLEESGQQQLLHELIMRNGFSVRQAEQAAEKLQTKQKKPPITLQTRNFFLESLAGKLQEKLGTKVAIQGIGKKGRISIDYYSYDDLDRLLEMLGICQN